MAVAGLRRGGIMRLNLTSDDNGTEMDHTVPTG